MMTRKDFEQLADLISQIHENRSFLEDAPDVRLGFDVAVYQFRRSLSEFCAERNPNFDPEKFLARVCANHNKE